jgi:hypothetical protein
MKKKPARKRTKAKVRAPKRPAPRKASAKLAATAKAQAKPQAKTGSKTKAREIAKARPPAARKRRSGVADNPALVEAARSKGLGSNAGGQSGDVEGLSGVARADSESVEELTEEGQGYEAGIVSGVEDALDPDEGEVTTSERPEDDVPLEYDDDDTKG